MKNITETIPDIFDFIDLTTTEGQLAIAAHINAQKTQALKHMERGFMANRAGGAVLGVGIGAGLGTQFGMIPEGPGAIVTIVGAVAGFGAHALGAFERSRAVALRNAAELNEIRARQH